MTINRLGNLKDKPTSEEAMAHNAYEAYRSTGSVANKFAAEAFEGRSRNLDAGKTELGLELSRQWDAKVADSLEAESGYVNGEVLSFDEQRDFIDNDTDRTEQPYRG
jgi:hypothetical protein